MLGRTGRLLLSGARIATKELTGRLAAARSEAPDASRLATKIRQTQDLVQTLGQLKGAAMKAGQLLSLEFSDLLPPEVVDVLRQLHDASTFLPFPKVRAILAAELGEARLAELRDLTEKPIAAASIGQVHKAVVGGRSVIVKIQFPGVADSIDSDLAVLRRTVGMILQMQGKQVALDALFEELARGLKQETDYLLEADHAERYRAVFSHASYVVPEVYRNYTTRRVLTLSYEHGARLADWLKAGPGPVAIQTFAHLILELLVAEFFMNGLVQTDPNYGNFLYRPVDGKLVVLDFGAVNVYDRDFRAQIRELILCAADGDEARTMELTRAFGFLDPRESVEAVARYLEMLRLIVGAFARDRQPFRFADGDFLKDIREASLRFVQSVRYSAPAKQVIFLNRKLGGMFHLLKDAGAELDLGDYLARLRALEL